jgi:hypothetical protein
VERTCFSQLAHLSDVIRHTSQVGSFKTDFNLLVSDARRTRYATLHWPRPCEFLIGDGVPMNANSCLRFRAPTPL